MYIHFFTIRLLCYRLYSLKITSNSWTWFWLCLYVCVADKYGLNLLLNSTLFFCVCFFRCKLTVVLIYSTGCDWWAARPWWRAWVRGEDRRQAGRESLIAWRGRVGARRERYWFIRTYGFCGRSVGGSVRGSSCKPAAPHQTSFPIDLINFSKTHNAQLCTHPLTYFVSLYST